jgi:WD40 repeat protein
MVPTPERLQPNHLEVIGWNMTELLQDLATAKKILRPKSNGLSPFEQDCLCLLLAGIGPDEIPKRLGRKGSIRPDLTKGLYGYIEVHLEKRPRDWRDIQLWYEPEYRLKPTPELTAGVEVQVDKQEALPEPSRHIDLDEAPEIEHFYGREIELAQLKQSVLSDRCKLLTILGMGGIGKSSLATVLVNEVQDEFDHVIWRSLRNMPPIEEVLGDIILFIASQPVSLPERADQQFSLLMNYLRKYRCLVILDNAESILQFQNNRVDDGFSYSQFFQRIGEDRHISCCLLTSRERFRELASLEGKKVRSFPLSGLSPEAGYELLTEIGLLKESDCEWQRIVEHYAGNPLALKIMAAGVRDILGNDVARFLEIFDRDRDRLVFGDINDLLQRQFNLLPNFEQEIMYWLAILREPIIFEELRVDLVSPQSKDQLFGALNKLQGRSLIERNKETKFTQQPVVMEYVTNRLIEEVCQEIVNQIPQLFNRLSLMKAQAKDYIRVTQIHFILEPLAERIATIFANESKDELAEKLISLKSCFQNKSGYFGGNLLNLLGQLNISLDNRDFSNLRIWQAYLQGRNLQNTSFINSDLSYSVFTKTFGSVLCVAFDPDNQWLASGDTSGDLNIWEVSTGRQLVTCKGHTNRIWAVAINPRNSIIATSSSDCSVKLWNQEGQCIHTLTGHTHRVWDVAFSPDGTLLASGGGGGRIKLWNVNTGKCLRTIEAHTQGVRTLAFSPAGDILASGGEEDKTIKLWDVQAGECLITIDAHNGAIRKIAFSLESPIFATCSEDQTIKLWNFETREFIKALPPQPDQIWSIAFVPSSNILVAGDQSGSIKLWDIETSKCIQVIEENTGSGVQAIAVSPNGAMLASGSNDQTIKLWQMSDGECLRSLHGYTNWILSAEVSPDTRTLVTASNDQTVRLWNIETGECFCTLYGHRSPVQIAIFSPDGTIVASADDLGVIKLWDAKTGRLISTFHQHTSTIWNLKFSADGEKLVSCSNDRTARIWKVPIGQCLQVLTHSTQVWAARFSPNGQTLLTATDDGVINAWVVDNGSCLFTIQGHQGQIWSVAFIEEGRAFISGSHDGRVRIWNAETGENLKTIHCTNHIWSISFSPDGRFIAGDQGSIDVQIWDFDSGKCIKSLEGHTSWVWSVAFSPNSNHLTSTSQDETVRLWDTQTWECVRIFRIARPYEGMNITGAQGLTDAQRATLKALGAIDDSA